MIRQIGFGEGEALIPNDNQLFRGFDFLRDYFAFPRRFLGFDLADLDAVASRLDAKSIDIVFAFDDVNPQLAAAVRKEMFALYTAPGANLFEKRLDRIPVKSNQFEFPVIPDRTRTLDYETNRVRQVFAHVPGSPQKLAVEPLYSARAARNPTGLTYTVRRLPRQRTADERKYGPVSDYVGTDVFLSLGERADPDETLRVAELSVDALCTNRHLAAHLPVGESGADFRFLDDSELELTCVGGPTKPLEPALTSIEGRGLDASTGEVAWRLISMLSLNHLGLADRANDGAEALRETLVLFADLSDAAADAKIRGVRSVTTRPTVRRLRQASGAAAARGLEITVVLEGRAFEGSGAFLLGADPRPLLRRIYCDQPLHPDDRPHRRARRNDALAAASGLERRSLMFRSELAGRAVALRSARRAAAPRTGKSGQTAHWRSAQARGRIRRDLAKPLSRISRLEPRSGRASNRTGACVSWPASWACSARKAPCP